MKKIKKNNPLTGIEEFYLRVKGVLESLKLFFDENRCDYYYSFSSIIETPSGDTKVAGRIYQSSIPATAPPGNGPIRAPQSRD